MTIDKPMVPENEMDRLLSLSEFDIDFSSPKSDFDELAKLAAKIAGTNISQINLIDSFTQWTISNYGLEGDQTPREDTACQYTIMQQDYFEVDDMTVDDRFKDKSYVVGDPMTRYYLGVPLTVGNGLNIGALCVLDQEKKKLTRSQVELLKIIAAEIVSKLRANRVLEDLRDRIIDEQRTKRKVAHDIRGPLAGIIGLSEIIESQGLDNEMSEVLELVSLIQQSGNSLIELTTEILQPGGTNELTNGSTYTLSTLREKLIKLYGSQAKQKDIELRIVVGSGGDYALGKGGKLLQIAGNIISNALKFSEIGGVVAVTLSFENLNMERGLTLEVQDSGRGMSFEEVQAILNGNAQSTAGTMGEQGFGFGLAFVKHLVDQENGTIEIVSSPGKGATFSLYFPQ